MDGRRFDRMTKTMSAWVSRRRLLTGLGMGAAGGLLRLPNQQGNAEALGEIRRTSEEALGNLPGSEDYEDQLFDPDRLPDFIIFARALAEQGVQAADDSGNPLWNDDQLAGFLGQVEGMPLSVSIGTDAHLEQWVSEQPGSGQEATTQAKTEPEGSGLRAMSANALQATPTNSAGSPPRPTICTTPCLEAWSACTPDVCSAAGVATTQGCRTFCFWQFVQCVVGCLQATMIPCTGDCG